MMAASALSGISEATAGKDLRAVESMTWATQFASLLAMSQHVNGMDSTKGPLSVEPITNYLKVYDAAKEVRSGVNTAQAAMKLTDPSKFDIFTPLHMYFVASYANNSLNNLGNLPIMKDLPNLIKSLTQQK